METYNWRLAGYTRHTLPRSRGVSGCITLVRSTIPQHRILQPVSCGEGVEVLAVELILPTTRLTIYNIYRKVHQTLDLVDIASLASERPCLIGGDFNAHHPILHSTRTEAAGRHLDQILDAFPTVALLNTGVPTHTRGGRLDLTISSIALAAEADWRLHPTLTSDHFAIVVTLQLDRPVVPLPPPRWKLEKADWGRFRKCIEEWWRDYQPAEDLDTRSDDFTKAITAAADQAIPKTNPRSHNNDRKWWFKTEKVKRHNRRVNDARKIYKDRPSADNLTFLKEAIFQARQVAKEARTDCWLEWCASFDQHTDLGTLWSHLKIATGRPPPRPPAHANPQEEATKLMTEFTHRSATYSLPVRVRAKQLDLLPQRVRDLDRACQEEDPADVPFTQQELEEARRGRRDTASGSDGIRYSMLANAGEAGDQAYLSLFNLSWSLGRSPGDWKEGDIVTVSKKGDPDKLRPLTMLKCPGKSGERMVLNRLRWRVGPPHPRTFGFVKGASTGDCIATVMSLIDHRPAIAVFLDLEKAFELASPAAILDALVRKGIRGRMLAWIRDYLQGRKSRVRLQGHTSTYSELENGTPQGGVLSPFLFNLLMEVLVSILLPRGTHLLSYADDLVLVVTGANKFEAAQRALHTITEKCAELGFKISGAKSKAMAFNSMSPPRRLVIQGTRLDWVREHLYLGVWLDSRMDHHKQVDSLVTRMKARVNVMRAMTNPAAGTSSQVLRTFYVHAIRPLVDYSCPVLINLTQGERSQLEKVQNEAMRVIVQAPRWTHIGTLLAETGLTTLHLRIQQMVSGRVARALQKDDTSTFRKRLGPLEVGRYLRKSQWTRAAALATTTTLPHWRTLLEPDRQHADYHPHPPWEAPPITTTFTRLRNSKDNCTREEMRQMALETMEQLHTPGSQVYYTDGSVDSESGRAGAAYVIGAVAHGWRTSDHCSSLQTELAAILGALQHFENSGGQRAVVHTDSKTALQALSRSHHPDNVALVTSILGLASNVKARGATIALNWIPSHVGLWGNEKADVTAREAAKGPLVLQSIRQSLRQTRSEAKRSVWAKQAALHRELVDTSRSMAWYTTATEFTPVHPNLKINRRTEVAAHRLRLGFKTADGIILDREAEPCRHCNAPSPDLLLHYVLYCPRTADLRTRPLPPGNELSRAASVVRRACEAPDVLIPILRDAPPPR